jgi:hypothetical protein
MRQTAKRRKFHLKRGVFDSPFWAALSVPVLSHGGVPEHLGPPDLLYCYVMAAKIAKIRQGLRQFLCFT